MTAARVASPTLLSCAEQFASGKNFDQRWWAFEKLREQIADSAARSDIELYCQQRGKHPVSGMPVYDLTQVVSYMGHRVPFDMDEHAFLVNAFVYLNRRELLERDAATPHLVSFKRDVA